MPTYPRLKNSDNLSQWSSKVNEGFTLAEAAAEGTLTVALEQLAGEFIVYWGQDTLTNTNKSFGTHYNTSSPYQQLGDLTVSIPTNNQSVRQIKITNSGSGYATPPTFTFSDPYVTNAENGTVSAWSSGTSYSINAIVSVIGGDSKKRFYKATTSISSGGSSPSHTSGITSNWLFIGRTAQVTVTVAGNVISTTSLNDGGFGYSALPTLTVSSGSGVLTPVMYCDVVAGLTDGSIANKPLITSLTDVTRATDYLLVYDSYSGATSFANSLKKIQISTITPDVPTGSVLFGSPTDSYIWDSTNFHWDDTNNRLGVGTNTPDALLTVNGVGAFGDGATGFPSITNTGDLDTGFWFPLSNTIAASTAGVERFRVLSTGEIGIGTINPDALLTVNGVGAFGDGATGFPSITNTGDLDTGFWFPLSNTIAASTAGVERFRVLSTGEIGIGTINPDALLTVAGVGAFGDGSVSAPSISNTGDLNTGFWFPAADTIAASTAGVERFRILSTGEIGIGITPTSKFHIATLSNDGISVTSTDGTTLRGVFYNTGGNSIGIGTTTNHPVALYTNNTERIRITADGNVGIGTNTPDALLTVAGVGAFGDGSGPAPSISNTGDLNTGFWFPAADTIAASTAGVERFRVTSDGNIQIAGSANPGVLSVLNTGSVQVTTLATARSLAVTSIQTLVSSGWLLTTFMSGGNPSMQVVDQAGTSFNNFNLMPFGGNVGIGTTSPVYKLDVGGFAAAAQTIRVASTGAISSIRLMEADDTYGFSLQNINGSRFAIFRHNASQVGSEVLSIDRSTGNVGIGTITSGTWNGSVIAGLYGGTGVANSGKTITLGGNLTTSGAFGITLTASGTTSVTLPTSGTLLTNTSRTIQLTGNITGTTTSDLTGNISIATTLIATTIPAGSVWQGDPVPVAVTLQTSRTFSLAGNVTATAVGFNGSANVVLSTVIASGAVTDTMLAGSISNAKLSNSAITINGTAVSLGGSITVATVGGSNTQVQYNNVGTLAGSPNMTFDGTRLSVLNLTVSSNLTGTLTGNATTATTANNILNQSNSATITATSSNVGNQIVLRDGSGNFTAGTITAALSGNATTATTASNLAGLSLPASGTLVNTVGTGATGTWGISITGNAATASSITSQANSATITASLAVVANTIVLRDGVGDLYGRYINANYFNSTDDIQPGPIGYVMAKFGDNYIRSATAARVATFISGQSMSIVGNATTATTASSITSQANSATITATSSNVGNQIVLRDGSGNFTAGTITAGSYGAVSASTGNFSGQIRASAGQSSGVIANATGSLGGIEVYGGGGANAAFINFHRPGAFAAYFGLDGSEFKVGGWSMGAASFTLLHSGNYTSYAPSLTGSGASGTWGINITGQSTSCSGNAATATSANTAVNLSTTSANWSTNGVISAVVGQLAWKNYANGHTIFDASNGTSPTGSAVNNTNSAAAWSGTYPTLMGWNGASTYGVRVDSARISDSTTGNAGSITGQANSATINATSSNVANQIVLRDGSGNFTAGTITAGSYGAVTASTGAFSGKVSGSGASYRLVLPVGTNYWAT